LAYTSIHFVDVRILDKGITMLDAYGAWTSIHLAYFRIPGKGITIHGLAYI
jgi:hypothetical protein